jgi:hypothetical protein
MEVDLPWSIDQGRLKRQYFRCSTRSSGEKLTVFVNLYDNTDFHTAYLPGGKPYNIEHQVKFPGREYYRVRHTDLKSLVEGDNTIEALDAYTNIIVWQIRDIN